MPSDPGNVPSATALTFEKWWGQWVGHDASGLDHAIHSWSAAWSSRQPEIDALRERERRLREYAECHDSCASNACTQCDGSTRIGYSHSSRRHDFQPHDCNCGLAALLTGDCLAGLLAAKEGS